MLPPDIKSSTIAKYCKYPRRLAFATLGFIVVMILFVLAVVYLG